MRRIRGTPEKDRRTAAIEIGRRAIHNPAAMSRSSLGVARVLGDANSLRRWVAGALRNAEAPVA
ncbi:MAG: hypothetical protein WD066_16935, partial [Planctomycetaceae bacterium]